MTKEEQKAYRRNYYLKNRGRQIAYALKWNKEHPERKRENSKSFYRRHSTLKAEEARRWKLAHPLEKKLGNWQYDDSHKLELRTKNMEYNLLHPDLTKRTAEKFRNKPENKRRMTIVQESLRLVREGLIVKTACSCGETQELKLFHLDYIDPYHVLFMCKECFWASIKARNRQLKIEVIKQDNP